jgi:C-terminal processing protease CtpA/Prc
VRVAVLVGPKTGSSGEFVAALFKGKAGARLFGAPTAGALSANANFELGSGLSVTLTTDIVRTSDGVLHKDERLLPDVVTKRPMAAAVAWLRDTT